MQRTLRAAARIGLALLALAATGAPSAFAQFTGHFKILARHSGKAVVVQGASLDNNAPVIQFTYGGANTNDEWEIIAIGGGFFRVMNRNSGKAMVVQSASTASGAPVIQFTYGGANTNDEWRIDDLGTGFFRFINRNSGLALDVRGASTDNGAVLQQSTSNGGQNQQFQIVSVDAAANPCARLDNGGPRSQWAFWNPDGSLTYRNLSNGDHIMDFSSAGYGGGGVAIPSVPTRVTLSPTASGDDTSRIQAAIDQVSALATDARGIRGAVLLGAGSYRLAGTLHVAQGGVVLRGSGSDPSGTVVRMTGDPHLAIEVLGSGSWVTGTSTAITGSYSPSGSRSLTVANASGFRVGDTVLVNRPATEEWIHFMGMDQLVRDGAAQTWIRAGSLFRTDRVVSGINGNQVTLDVPLSDSIDSTLISGATLARYTFAGRLGQVGIENLRFIGPPSTVPIDQAQFRLLTMAAVIDAWVRNVFAQDFVNGIDVQPSAKRVTLENVTLTHSVRTDGSAGAPADFSLRGTQVLLHRSSSTGQNVFYAATQAMNVGPIVVLNFTGAQGNAIQPHQRWATGLLVDNATVTGGIEYMSRGNAGSGHGWTMGFGVAWNCGADRMTVQQPPGSENWSIGCSGQVVDRPHLGLGGPNLPRGEFESHGTVVTPQSLYLAQLCSRLGPQALTNIGY